MPRSVYKRKTEKRAPIRRYEPDLPVIVSELQIGIAKMPSLRIRVYTRRKAV